MQLLLNRAVELRLKNPNHVLDNIKESRHVAPNTVVVKWGVEEAIQLTELGFKIPSPIEKKYKWTGMYHPYDHQIATASFLSIRKRAFVFNEQGTGKTSASIWAADYLMKQGVVKRALIVCPLSIMDSAWRTDLFKSAMHRSVGIAYGTQKARRKVILGSDDFVIINYDGINIVKEDIARGGFDLIIIDEATHYKNPETKRWKVLNKLVTAETWVWMMTGTPAAQSPEEAYGLAKLMNPASVPRSAGVWRDMVMFKVSQFRWVPKPNAVDMVHDVLQPAIRFTKDDCLDLPEMVYMKRDVQMSKVQKHYYDELKQQLLTEIDNEEITAVNAAVSMNKLLQIATGCVYSDTGEVIEFDLGDRYRVLKEVIDESEKKVLVFVPFRHTIDSVAEKLRSDKYTTEIIRGDVPVSKRTAIFKRFQEDEDPRVLVIQPQSAAHGVTLTAANTVVWWSPTSSLETYAQANARVHRSGQDHKCTVVQLQGSNVEKRVFKLLDDRINIHTKIIDLYSEILD